MQNGAGPKAAPPDPRLRPPLPGVTRVSRGTVAIASAVTLAGQQPFRPNMMPVRRSTPVCHFRSGMCRACYARTIGRQASVRAPGTGGGGRIVRHRDYLAAREKLFVSDVATTALRYRISPAFSPIHKPSSQA